MRNTIILVLLCCFFVQGNVKAQETKFQRPPAVLEEVAMAKLSPVVSISNDSEWAVLLERSPYQSLFKLSQPELKIAGTRINPATFGMSRQSGYTGASFMKISSGVETPITGIPSEAVIVMVSFSPKSQQLILFVEEDEGVYLYSASPNDPVARKVTNRKVNTTAGLDIEWIDDNTFITLLVPANVGKVPEEPRVPAGPVIQENIGKAQPARTYQDLLTNPYDEQLFDYYFTSQLAIISNGTVTEIFKPCILGASFSLSPDKSLILMSTIEHPYSYQVPMYNFPQRYLVIDIKGNVVKELANNPVVLVPMGHDTASPYPRSFSWRNDKPATVFWIEPQDEGNPRENKADYMDIAYQWAYPFDAPKQEVAKTVKRMSNILWHDDSFAIMNERSRADNRVKTWAIKPMSGEEPQLLFDRSSSDNYNNPGNPVMVRNAYGKQIVYTNKAKTELLMSAPGASPEGDKPYISRFNMRTKKSDILWRCEDPYYETITKVVDPDKLMLITSRQSADEPANMFVRDLKRKRSTQLTHFGNPYPAMEGVYKEKIQYKRADGLDLTATVYLPKGYNKERDGRLPVLMWAYPREYRSAAEAAQVRGSKYTFTNIGNNSPVFWVLRGYCVMENVEMPIVSATEDAEPNDNFVEQLTMNAEAAVKVITDMGVGDPDRIAVGGHSYGAFMTANLMVHTKLFKAGIARSGAYNRTLTPFGFQAETRTYWEAPEVYNTMSPFMHANKLSGALLIIHGEMDNNSGTFPIQSERLYSALQGHGATTRYVVLPYESHGYAAQENILHLLWEADTWLETYVKNAKK